MSLKNRLLELISLEGLNPNQFYVKTGLGIGFLDKVGEKLKRPSVEKISATFPRWNIDYLRTGEGEKYKENNQTISDVQNSPMTAVNFNGNNNNFPCCDREIIKSSFDSYQQMIKKQQEQMDDLISIITKLTSK